MNQRKIIVIAHDMRSAHNVGALMRTSEGLGVMKLLLTGYTPHPTYDGDSRLPHLARAQSSRISKTALGTETVLSWQYQADIFAVITDLKKEGYCIAALEQATDSIMVPDFLAPVKIAVLLGREVEGLAPELLAQADVCMEIPMFGKKESFNVVEAASMALYHLRFIK